MFVRTLILFAVLLTIFEHFTVESAPHPRLLIRTGRSRLKYVNQAPSNAWRAYPWPLMRKRSSVPIALPGWRLAMVGEPIGRSSLGCGGETARCFFGLFGSGNDREYYGNDGGQGRPPFYSPPPLQPGGMGMGPGMMGGYYGGGGYDEDEDYVEICDEFYDPLHDEYIEDCNTIPDYYK